ncbi:hypothetical protein BCR42DRAFT_138109 [Absidia repens]|uniref:Uncharacterized protein n=1 Tax=Absidia repens TaxID=90262 RepID=A0A1X2IWZ7_9FUNG|nr:hypothetical protein BCR42DRAFT_138109 [Absidia repens]
MSQLEILFFLNFFFSLLFKAKAKADHHRHQLYKNIIYKNEMMEDDQLDFGDLDDFDDTLQAIDQDLVIESTRYEDEIAKMERELGLDNSTQPVLESEPLTTQSSLSQQEDHTKSNTAINSQQEDLSKNCTATKGKNSSTATISSHTAAPSSSSSNSNSSNSNKSTAAIVETRARRFGKNTIQQRTNTTYQHNTHPSRQPQHVKPSSTSPAVLTPVPSLSSTRRGIPHGQTNTKYVFFLIFVGLFLQSSCFMPSLLLLVYKHKVYLYVAHHHYHHPVSSCAVIIIYGLWGYIVNGKYQKKRCHGPEKGTWKD